MMVIVKNSDNEKLWINTDHITWIDVENKEIMFFGSASLAVIEESLDRLLMLIKAGSL
jgi:hypothetical protein